MLPFDDREGDIWFDGRLTPWREARIHVLSHGLHYASCVFEGARAYDGRVFRCHEHATRLLSSALALGFEIPFTASEIAEACQGLICRHSLQHAYVRPIAWRGSEDMGVSGPHAKVHVAIAAWNWPSVFEGEAKTLGIRLRVSRWRRPAPDTAPTRAKAAGLYMICTLSRREAEQAGADDALMLDHQGLVAEATGANLFFVARGELHTPTPTCFLDGITRQTVMALAKAAGIPVHERQVTLAELCQADEVFLTGTAYEVQPVRQIDDHHFKPGPVTRLLMDAYSAEVRRPG